ncbi:hyaluronan-binding protein 2 [Parambassis ranga]|uniref:trypsin n=1 Tax=Parambassis ranga TaxID=210632 RepID=A0A6P7K9Z5_9TELE|nr:hyaluronan-binding protein 2 [Parambassis ranga]
MLAVGALLILFSIATVHGQGSSLDVEYIEYDYDYNDTTDAPDISFNLNDWLFNFLKETNVCDPNPCFSGGSCQNISDSEFTCFCPEPYIGKRCQKVRNVCENAKCGFGDCIINLNKPPFFECMCKPPYQGPDCKTLPPSPCEPNPCQNGGSCFRGKRRFRCACPDGYYGKFCSIASSDCYEGNGETYRGAVDTTEEGKVCLDWRSNTIVLHGEDPFITYSHFNGLVSNRCRNPDGETKPWCFVKNKGKLQWEYCNVKKCSEAPGSTSSPAPVTPATPATNTSQFSQCGSRQSFRSRKIYGGSKTFPGALPWQVSLQTRLRGSDEEFSHFCGGILLSSCWVLTAAHCINSSYEAQVVMGGVHVEKYEHVDQTIPVIKAFVHENYTDTTSAVYNDIALLRLKVTDNPYCAKETQYVKSACLPDQMFPAGKECVISGWGATETDYYSGQLLNARVLLISEDLCKASHVYGDLLDQSMLCAGTMKGGIDSCQGDSGGPLVCEQNGTHYITGVVSWGEGCGEENKPGVYTNVHTFLDWITSKMD